MHIKMNKCFKNLKIFNEIKTSRNDKVIKCNLQKMGQLKTEELNFKSSIIFASLCNEIVWAKLNHLSGDSKSVFCAIMEWIIIVLLTLLFSYYFILSHSLFPALYNCILQANISMLLDNWLWQRVNQRETSKKLKLQGKNIKKGMFPFCDLACCVQAPSNDCNLELFFGLCLYNSGIHS